METDGAHNGARNSHRSGNALRHHRRARARRFPVSTAVVSPPGVSVQLGPSLTVAGLPVRVLVALLGSGPPSSRGLHAIRPNRGQGAGDSSATGEKLLRRPGADLPPGAFHATRWAAIVQGRCLFGDARRNSAKGPGAVRWAVTAHSGCADPQSFSRMEGHRRKALSSRRLIAGLVVVTYVDHAVCHSEQKFSAVSIVPL